MSLASSLHKKGVAKSDSSKRPIKDGLGDTAGMGVVTAAPFTGGGPIHR